ncbi:MAG: hypothetical protein IKN43_01375 [Selenomonadaceae bacterium]|nr:hypothetical protein [Selenomonadaceae bacterium]
MTKSVWNIFIQQGLKFTVNNVMLQTYEENINHLKGMAKELIVNVKNSCA